MPRSNKKKSAQKNPFQNPPCPPPPEPPPPIPSSSSEIAMLLENEKTIMIRRAISSGQKHGINFQHGRPNPGTGDCAFEAAIFNNNDRACFPEKFLNSIDYYRRLFVTDMANRTLYSPYNTLPPTEWLKGWSEMLESGAYERGIFGDLMVPGIACGLKKDILIFNTDPASPHDPIYVVSPSDFNVHPDTEIPIVLCYNMAHYESLEPCTEHDVQATVSLAKDYKEGRYSYSRKDIPNLVSANFNLQLPSPSPYKAQAIESEKPYNLEKGPKKNKQYNSCEKSQPKDSNRVENTDEINLEEIDEYLESCKPKTSRERGETSSTSLADNLFYKLNNKSVNYKIKNVEGKMECPFCKLLVKNIKIHFERKQECGTKIDIDHFANIFEAYKKAKQKEQNKKKQQTLKEKDPAK